MSRTLIGELNLERYADLVSAILGRDAHLGLLDREDDLVWAHGERARLGVLDVLRRLQAGDGDQAAALGGDGELAIDGQRTLLWRAIDVRGRGRVGRLVLVVEQGAGGDAPRRPADVAPILTHLAGLLADEYVRVHDLDNLAGELSSRYEELNLLYSIEGQVRNVDAGSLGIRALLHNLADHLLVDVAALVTRDLPTPIYATNLGEEFAGLDLLLTQLRGDLFRFLRVGRKPVVINEPDDPRRAYILSGFPFRLLACPVAHEGVVEGMLVLFRQPDSEEFSNSDRNLATVIANQTAIVMRNQSMLAKLRHFGEEMAAALIEAIESKDPYTRGHSERVQQISTQIGRTAGMNDRQLEGIYWGALLHDVGKLGVPDVILCKPGRLTEDEYTFIKIHPERSYEIMRHIAYLSQEALEGARYHQEKFDGTGYPHGLKGEDIPAHARLIAVADTYDAITTSRSYRSGRTHEEAMTRIREVAGSQLDPKMVEIFERACGESVQWLRDITVPALDDDG